MPAARAGNCILPEDIVIEILSELPAKSLAKFKCVSKSWKDLISDPAFVIKHLISATRKGNEKLLVYWRNQSKHLITLTRRINQKPDNSQILYMPFLGENNDYFQIVGSCNGVLCIGLCERGLNLYLYNPTTGDFMNLPQPPQTMEKPDDQVALGFGYNTRTNDYEVVRFSPGESYERVTTVAVEVYSKNLGSWSSVSCVMQCRLCGLPPSPSSVAFSGAIHWRGSKQTVNGHTRLVMSCFDLENKVFKEIAVPVSPGTAYNALFLPWEIMVVEDSLGAAFLHESGEEGIIDVWVMKIYGVENSWTKQFSLSFPLILHAISLPLWCNKKGEITMRGRQNELLSLDPATMELKTFHVESEYGCRAKGYIESLVPITR